MHGDRRSEMLCIGKFADEIIREAARAQMEACLLTEEEMAGGEKSWLALPDPFTAWEPMQGGPFTAWEPMQGGHSHVHDHSRCHGHVDAERKVRKASVPFSSFTSKKHVHEHRGHGSDDADAIRNEHAHEHGGHEHSEGCGHSHADCGHDHADGKGHGHEHTVS
jgi:hypothetical protein